MFFSAIAPTLSSWLMAKWTGAFTTKAEELETNISIHILHVVLAPFAFIGREYHVSKVRVNFAWNIVSHSENEMVHYISVDDACVWLSDQTLSQIKRICHEVRVFIEPITFHLSEQR